MCGAVVGGVLEVLIIVGLALLVVAEAVGLALLVVAVAVGLALPIAAVAVCVYASHRLVRRVKRSVSGTR